MGIREEVMCELLENADENYGEFNRKLIPGSEGIIGVRMPVIRRIVRNVSGGDWREYLEGRDVYFEEVMIRGLVICLAPEDAEERMRLAEGFIPRIDNWAVCDAFCSAFKPTDRDRRMIWDSVLAHHDDGTEFGMRYAAVMMKSHFLDDGSIDAVLRMLSSVRHQGYYLKMGVAWALAECYVKYPERTDPILRGGALETDVLRMTIGKITDSYRVDAKAKEDLRLLRSSLRSP
jgi:3-methyladenine DNA glycosylase AlkD